MISLLLASTLVFGDMDEKGSARKFCTALQKQNPTTIVMDSTGGYIDETLAAINCVRKKDVIVKVKRSESAATYFLQGLPFKCLLKGGVVTTHNTYSDEYGERLEDSRDVFLTVTYKLLEWGVDEKDIATLVYLSMMTPSESTYVIEEDMSKNILSLKGCVSEKT